MEFSISYEKLFHLIRGDLNSKEQSWTFYLILLSSQVLPNNGGGDSGGGSGEWIDLVSLL